MELTKKLRSASDDLENLWPKLHLANSSESTKNILHAIKKINTLVEDINLELLEIESSLQGHEMSKERKEELENCRAAEKLYRSLIPIALHQHVSGF